VYTYGMMEKKLGQSEGCPKTLKRHAAEAFDMIHGR
jgi:hypothetical protein